MRELSVDEAMNVNGGSKFFSVIGSTLFGAAIGAVMGAVTLGPIGIIAGAGYGAADGFAGGLALAGGEGLMETLNDKK